MPRYQADNLGEVGVRGKTRGDYAYQPVFSAHGMTSINLVIYHIGVKPLGPKHKLHFSASSTMEMIPVYVTVVGKRHRVHFSVELVMTEEEWNLNPAEQRSFCVAVSEALEPHIEPLTLVPRPHNGQCIISTQILDLSGTR